MIPEKVTWVRLPARISAAYRKLLPLNNSVFQFSIKHLHICYKFSYRISDQEVCLALLNQNIVLQNKFCNFSPNFFILLCWFGYSKNNSISGYIYKVVNSRYKNYVLFISQINLIPFRPILEIDWCL